MNRPFLRAAIVAMCVSGCGAKTGLRVDGGVDAEDVRDVVAPDVPRPTYLGTEFWAVSTSNTFLRLADRFNFAVALGNPSMSPVNITITGGRGPMLQFSLPARSTVTRTLPWVQALVQRTDDTGACGPVQADRRRPPLSALVQDGAYRIQSSAPINAYQFNPLEYVANDVCMSHSYTNDASLLLPTEALTANYLVVGHGGFNGGGAFVAIVGTQATPTTVAVTLTATVTAGSMVAGGGPGTTQMFTLRRGEVVQLVTPSGGRAEDPTGSVIRASAPVAVFTGVDCTTMSWPDGSQYACDHIEEQLFPEETWGREVIVTQLQDRGPDERSIIRIASRVASNQLTFEPPGAHAPVTLQRGQIVDFESGGDFIVRGTGPILVAQFMEGQQTTPGASVGDPAMVFEVPSAQFRRDYSFVVPYTYTSSFVNITARAGAAIFLDERALSGSPSAIAGTPWVVWRLPINAGSHLLRTESDAGIGLKVLGVASFTSYAYPGGLDLARMP